MPPARSASPSAQQIGPLRGDCDRRIIAAQQRRTRNPGKRHDGNPQLRGCNPCGLVCSLARGRNAVRCAGGRQDRHAGADDGAFHLDRQATRRRCAPLHGASRRQGRGKEDRAHRQGRHRQSRRHQAARAGARRQRQGRGPRRIRPHPRRARGGADRHRSEGSGNRDDGRDVGHHRALALHRAGELFSAADDPAACRLGRGERHQEGGHGRLRLRARHRHRDRLQASASKRSAAR